MNGILRKHSTPVVIVRFRFRNRRWLISFILLTWAVRGVIFKSRRMLLSHIFALCFPVSRLAVTVMFIGGKWYVKAAGTGASSIRFPTFPQPFPPYPFSRINLHNFDQVCWLLTAGCLNSVKFIWSFCLFNIFQSTSFVPLIRLRVNRLLLL